MTLVEYDQAFKVTPTPLENLVEPSFMPLVFRDQVTVRHKQDTFQLLLFQAIVFELFERVEGNILCPNIPKVSLGVVLEVCAGGNPQRLLEP